MSTPSQHQSEETLDKTISILRKTRILAIVFLGVLGPMLYLTGIITDNVIVLFSVGFALMAAMEWHIIGFLIKRLEKTKEEIR